MLITDYFVLINFPKTGSTFAREAISEIYKKRKEKLSLLRNILYLIGYRRGCFLKELYLPKIEFRNEKGGITDQHGHYEQIPDEFRNKPVLSIVRDPVVRNISFYEYGWWKENYNAPLEEIISNFPTFPELDFSTYLKFQKLNSRYRDTGVVITDEVGVQTINFIQFYFKDPAEAFKKLNDNYINKGEYKDDLPDLTLLRTEHLNEDLYSYLIKAGFSANELDFIKNKKPVRPEQTERKTEKGRYSYIDDYIREKIRYSERYLYKIYSDFGIEY